MRAYIEKPRTTVGWKGFMYDPNLDGSSNLQLGLEKSRELYLQIIEKGLPIASEILSPMATGYFDDLLAWGQLELVLVSPRFTVKSQVICHTVSVSRMVRMVQFKLLWMLFSLHKMSINFRYESARFAFSDSECWESIATLDFTWSQSWSHYDLASIQAIRESTNKTYLP